MNRKEQEYAMSITEKAAGKCDHGLPTGCCAVCIAERKEREAEGETAAGIEPEYIMLHRRSNNPPDCEDCPWDGPDCGWCLI